MIASIEEGPQRSMICAPINCLLFCDRDIRHAHKWVSKGPRLMRGVNASIRGLPPPPLGGDTAIIISPFTHLRSPMICGVSLSVHVGLQCEGTLGLVHSSHGCARVFTRFHLQPTHCLMSPSAAACYSISGKRRLILRYASSALLKTICTRGPFLWTSERLMLRARACNATFHFLP